MVYKILILVFIHFIADFVCQTDNQAKNKSHDNNALLAHVFTYTGVSMILWGFTLVSFSLLQIVVFAAITFMFHILTDFFTSRLNAYLWKKNMIHEFFVSVGFDQFLHYCQLFLTFDILNNLNN